MFGVIVNTVAIAIGGIIGSLAKEKIRTDIAETVMKVMGVFSLFLGMQGAIKGEKVLLILCSLVIGTVVGELIDIDKYIAIFGEFLKKKCMKKANKGSERFVEAFVTSGALFGIGAMAILGSIDAGLRHNYDIFYTKSMMDFVTSIMFSSTMGIGVAFSCIIIFILQGGMTILATFIKPIADNALLMNEISSCGSLIIVVIGLNLLGITKLKIANMIPAILMVPILYYLMV